MPRLTKDNILEIFKYFHENNPAPVTELDYSNDFQLLIAVLLSAQATDKGVNKATKALFEICKTPQSILNMGHDELLNHIKSIGLYKTKGKNVMALCAQLMEHHNGEVPRTREALEALPGVGRKTANVVLNTAFGEKTMAVDTHIFRVANRLGLSNGKTTLAVELDLLKRIPDDYLLDAHHWLILHGRYICKSRTPDCGACALTHVCRHFQKELKKSKKTNSTEK